MRKHIISLFVIVLFIFSVLYGLQKQKKQLKPLEHEVTVELVVVEVFVTDKKGNFISDLTKDDFEIFEDGKRVEIQYFAVEAPEKEIPKKEVPEKAIERIKPPRPQEMKLVILFDNINTNRFFLNRYWPQFAEMFKALSDNVQEIMIMELNRESGARIIQPFTSEQDLLIDKISKFRVDTWKEFEKDLLRSQIFLLEKEAKLSMEDRFIGAPELLIQAIREEENFIRRRRLEDSLSTFLAAVNHIRQFGGIKSVLIVSDGFHIDRNKIVRVFDPFEIFGKRKLHNQLEAFEKFLKLINEEKLIFYAFSPKELRSSFSVNAPSYNTGELFQEETIRWARELYSLQEIAEESGGVYLRGEKKYENFVKELGRDLTHFYDISYTPPAESRQRGYHKIEVKIRRPGLIVRYKKGYSDFTEEELERKTIASAFLSPTFFKDISFSCMTDFISLDTGRPQFWIRIQIPLDQFRDIQEMASPEKLALMFGIKEVKKDKIHLGQTEIPIEDAIAKDIPSIYYAFLTSGVKLKPGEYSLRVILKHGANQLGGWETTLSIPDIKREPPASILNSIFGSLREEEEKRVSFSISEKDGAIFLSQYRFYPLAGNVFTREKEAAVFLQIYNPQETRDFAFQFFLLGDEDLTMNLPTQKIESFFDRKLEILNEVYLLEFQDIPPGDYKLKIKSPVSPIDKEMEIKLVY